MTTNELSTTYAKQTAFQVLTSAAIHSGATMDACKLLLELRTQIVSELSWKDYMDALTITNLLVYPRH
jgi:hypothetical protein